MTLATFEDEKLQISGYLDTDSQPLEMAGNGLLAFGNGLKTMMVYKNKQNTKKCVYHFVYHVFVANLIYHASTDLSKIEYLG
ncbi:hypothetical protein RhiirB3_431173 [Rhizophagus irregularis]|nr:hypothetical protein RhiirB3_431173 [Rhizophagus irregularis]